MIADVVVWHVLHDLPMDELNEAINWVLEAQFEAAEEASAHFATPEPIRIYLHWPPLRQVNVNAGSLKAWASHERENCIVVTNEPIDDAQAYDLWKQYEDQFTKGGDANGNDSERVEDGSGELPG